MYLSESLQARQSAARHGVYCWNVLSAHSAAQLISTQDEVVDSLPQKQDVPFNRKNATWFTIHFFLDSCPSKLMVYRIPMYIIFVWSGPRCVFASLRVVKRSHMERMTLARYFPLSWKRQQPLWGSASTGKFQVPLHTWTTRQHYKVPKFWTKLLCKILQDSTLSYFNILYLWT